MLASVSATIAGACSRGDGVGGRRAKLARGPGKPAKKPASAGRRLPLAVTSPTAPQAGMEGMRGRCVVRPPRHAVQSPLGARSVPGLGRHRPFPARHPLRVGPSVCQLV